jgi:glyoxylase-like metal-dependent hydrolase (beta-lactamase superfamily II)
MALSIHPMMLGESLGDTSFMVWGLTPGTKIWSPTIAYLIVGGEKVVVIDAGFRDAAELEASTGLPFRCAPEHALEANLARHGLEPGDVDIVVFTHLHFDHSGLADRFPNARLLVQRTELQYAAAPLSPAMFYERLDIAKLVDPLWPQIDLLDGDAEVIPGVRAVLTGGHSPGHQIIYVGVESGPAIVCGDIAYVVDPAVTQGIPPSYVISMPDTLAALARIKRDATHVLPMHDATVFATYPEGVS